MPDQKKEASKTKRDGKRPGLLKSEGGNRNLLKKAAKKRPTLQREKAERFSKGGLGNAGDSEGPGERIDYAIPASKDDKVEGKVVIAKYALERKNGEKDLLGKKYNDSLTNLKENNEKGLKKGQRQSSKKSM